MQEGDTAASIAEECGITPTQLKMINTLNPVEEKAHRKLHTEEDQQEMLIWDARKVTFMNMYLILSTYQHCSSQSLQT